VANAIALAYKARATAIANLKQDTHRPSLCLRAWDLSSSKLNCAVRIRISHTCNSLVVLIERKRTQTSY